MYTPSFNVKKNNVPIVSKNEIDRIGENIIADFCPSAMRNPSEIDIDSFVQNYLGITQDFQYLSNCGIYLGMTVFGDTNRIPVFCPETNTAEYIKVKARTVIIDKTLLEENQEHRYRFTMGHEAGHDILHSACFSGNCDAPMVKCRADNIKFDRQRNAQWSDNDWMEWQANKLASAILMPKSMVMKMVDDCFSIPPKYKMGNFIKRVSLVFNVSTEAALYRLQDLRIINPKTRYVI